MQMNVPVFINNNEGQTWQHVSQPVVVLVLCLEDYVCYDRRKVDVDSDPGLGKQVTLYVLVLSGVQHMMYQNIHVLWITSFF